MAEILYHFFLAKIINIAGIVVIKSICKTTWKLSRWIQEFMPHIPVLSFIISLLSFHSVLFIE